MKVLYDSKFVRNSFWDSTVDFNILLDDTVGINVLDSLENIKVVMNLF